MADLPVDEMFAAMEARTTCAARVGHHLRRAANAAMNELDMAAVDNELSQAVAWRSKWEASQAEFQRLHNAYYDQLEVRNAG